LFKDANTLFEDINLSIYSGTYTLILK
jgi:hypothetical protein